MKNKNGGDYVLVVEMTGRKKKALRQQGKWGGG